MRAGKVGVAALMLALLAAGCDTEADYEAGVAAMRKDPAVKAEAISRCRATMAEYPTSAKRRLAAYIGVSAADFPAVWCQRFIGLMASGRLSYRDYVDALNMDYSEDDKLFRMMRQGG